MRISPLRMPMTVTKIDHITRTAWVAVVVLGAIVGGVLTITEIRKNLTGKPTTRKGVQQDPFE
jgi:hypothetical protein